MTRKCNWKAARGVIAGRGAGIDFPHTQRVAANVIEAAGGNPKLVAALREWADDIEDVLAARPAGGADARDSEDADA